MAGKITNVSIPLRQGRRVRFGFVSFCDRDSLLRSIRIFNGKMVRGNNLVVLEAKPKRNRQYPVIHKDPNQRVYRRVVQNPDPTHKIVEEVGGSNKEVEIVGEVNNNVFSKLMASLVGEVDEPIECSRLLSELQGDLQGLVDASYLQWNKIFLHFSSEDLADRAMLESTLLHSLFSSVRKWSCYDVCDTRLVWLEVRGVPPLGWKKSNFSKIASHWGNFICLENRIEEARSYECMKVLISTDLLSSIKCQIKFSLEDKVFTVLVQESSKIANLDEIRCEEAVSHSHNSIHGETNPEADVSLSSSPLVSVNSDPSLRNITNLESTEVVPNSVVDPTNNILFESTAQPSPALNIVGPAVLQSLIATDCNEKGFTTMENCSIAREGVQGIDTEVHTNNPPTIINDNSHSLHLDSPVDALIALDLDKNINEALKSGKIDIQSEYVKASTEDNVSLVGEKSGEASTQQSLRISDHSPDPPPGFEFMKNQSSVKAKGYIKVRGKRKFLLPQGRVTNRFLEKGSRSRQSRTSSESITDSILKEAEKTNRFLVSTRRLGGSSKKVVESASDNTPDSMKEKARRAVDFGNRVGLKAKNKEVAVKRITNALKEHRKD